MTHTTFSVNQGTNHDECQNILKNALQITLHNLATKFIPESAIINVQSSIQGVNFKHNSSSANLLIKFGPFDP